MDRFRNRLAGAGRHLQRSPRARLALVALWWVVIMVAAAWWGDAVLWLGFALGALLPVSLWVAYEGFWLPRGSRLEGLLAITPREFEHAVAAMMVPLGYTDVRVTGGADDYGVDVLCRDPDGALVAIQCKQYSPGRTVSSSEVQKFIGGMQIREAQRGIIVTTASFSGPARDLARKQDIRLIGGEELVGFIAEGTL